MTRSRTGTSSPFGEATIWTTSCPRLARRLSRLDSSASIGYAPSCSEAVTGKKLARPALARPNRPSRVEIRPVGLLVDAPDALDLGHVRPRLREDDAGPFAPPAVHVPLARVVRGERGLHVAVAVAQVVEVPRAVADVDLRVLEVGEHEPRPAGASRDPLRRRRQELHQADGPGVRVRIRVEAALDVDDGGQEVGIEVVVACVTTDD